MSDSGKLQRLREFLQGELGRDIGNIELKKFEGGSSNLTYEVFGDNLELILRTPPAGNRVKSAHDMKREYDVLTLLATRFEFAPKPLAYCGDDEILGSEFLVMAKIDGLILRGDWPFHQSDADFSRNVLTSFLQTLVELHSIDVAVPDFPKFGNPVGYSSRQVHGWCDRYRKARTEELPDLEDTLVWLEARIPADDPPAFVHNDYKFDNVVFRAADRPEIVGVLDWEMATVGSPLMDLGTTLGYWMSASESEELLGLPFNPRLLMERYSVASLAEIYSELSGRNVDSYHYYYIFGTFKIAVIAQQIYRRYLKGHAKDKRFAAFGRFVEGLGRICVREIGKSNL
ncbi:MAG: phosphotransferase family protein [Pyrinomonadaceae bacterium]